MLTFHDPGEFDDKAREILQRSSYVRKIYEDTYYKMDGKSSCHRFFKSEPFFKE